MKRILFEVILVIALGVAGYFAWSQNKASSSAGGQLKDLTEQKSELQGKLEAAEKQLQAQAESLKQMGPRAQQFDAASSALSGGQVLDDLEKLYAGKKGLSNEQQLGLGVVRLLSKGPQDQGALQALNKTLEQIDWNRNQKIICATQNALAAAGKDVKVLAECQKTVSLAAENAPAQAPASPASSPSASPASAASEPTSPGKPKDSKKP